MKTIFRLSILTFLLFPGFLFSQISIQFSPINEYLFNTKEALNFIVINNGTKSVQVQFSGKITSPVNGNLVLFKSEPVKLNIGPNMISPSNLGLQEINYLNNDIREVEQKTGTFPSGAYTVCIWSACTSPDCDGSGPSAGSTEQAICTNITVENPTPLLLSYPSNESEIQELRPNYTWIPPAPIASSDALNYTMTLVEVYEGQSKSDALALNRPLLEMNGLSNPLLLHPSDIPALEEGKTYAWQVQAFIGQMYFSKSEQWKFKVKKEENKKQVGKILVILRSNDKEIHTAEDTLRMVYNELKKEGKLKFIIKDQNGIEIGQFESATVYGENIIWLDLIDPKFKMDLIYRICVFDGSKELYQLRFVVRR